MPRNALTANSELIDELVLTAARGNTRALQSLGARYSAVVTSAVRARVFATEQRIIPEERAWESACLAIRRVGALHASGTPFLAWLELSAEEAAGVTDAVPPSRHDDGLADADRCALELHVLGYGSIEIAGVLSESQTTVQQRIETTRQRLWARAMAEQVEA